MAHLFLCNYGSPISTRQWRRCVTWTSRWSGSLGARGTGTVCLTLPPPPPFTSHSMDRMRRELEETERLCNSNDSPFATLIHNSIQSDTIRHNSVQSDTVRCVTIRRVTIRYGGLLHLHGSPVNAESEVLRHYLTLCKFTLFLDNDWGQRARRNAGLELPSFDAPAEQREPLRICTRAQSNNCNHVLHDKGEGGATFSSMLTDIVWHALPDQRKALTEQVELGNTDIVHIRRCR